MNDSRANEAKRCKNTLTPMHENADWLTDIDQKLIDQLSALPEAYWDFKEDDTRAYTHGLHNYPAMMVYPISRNIIRIMREIMPVTALLDPFAGSGTVLVEGKLAALPTVCGNDINPLALLLTKVKTTNLDVSELRHTCDALRRKVNGYYHEHRAFFDEADRYMEKQLNFDLSDKKAWGVDAPEYLKQYCSAAGVAFTVPDFKNIGYWFKPQVILFLQMIKEKIEEIADQDLRDFVCVAFSETIRLVSNRRNGEFKMFRMPADKVRAFCPDVRKAFFTILERNVEKMDAFITACAERKTKTHVTIYSNNTMVLSMIPNDTFDLMITSPPYGDSRTTVAYGEYSRLSLQWLNGLGLSEKGIMGLDRSFMGGRKHRRGFEYSLNSPTLKQAVDAIKAIDLERAGDVYSFYDDLERSIAATAAKMKKGGYQFWVVGNRTVKKVLLQTDVIISEMAVHYGLKYVYTINRNIPNKVMPALNSPTNETGKTAATMTNEHIVILCKQ